nr:DUF11 domain-containing protein [Saccharothrix mutabilis subsp. capreolus]
MSTNSRSGKAVRVLLVVALVAAALAVPTPTATGAQIEPLTLGYQTSVYGDFIHVGNGNMRCPTAADNVPTYGFAVERCTNYAQTRSGTPMSNNWFYMKFADVDSDPTTFNSSTAQATIPPGATVKYARLNWSGMLPTNTNSCLGGAATYGGRPPGSADTQPVRLSVGSAPPIDFAPDHYASVAAGTTPGHYAAYADVTSAFANAPTGTALDLTVGNIWGFEGANCTAGWSIDIVYEYPEPDPTYAPNKRNVYLYNGLIVQAPREAAVSTTISGFKAALPTSRIGITAFDGDAGGATGDRFRVNGIEQREPLTNALGNFFNGNADGNTNPGYSDTMTIDAKSITSSAGSIPAGSTSATLTFSTSSDGFLFTNLAFSTAVAELDVLKVADPAVVHEGDTVTFTITATNRSALPLSNVVFDDPLAPDCNTTIPTIAANETISYTCTTIAGSDDFTNTITATGTDQFGDAISDVAETVVDVIHPAIEVVKDVTPAQAEEGDTVTYTITVRNTGDVPLTDITVDDPLLTACSTTFASLAAGAAITYTCTGQAPADDVTNTITATGRDSIGGLSTDTDDALLDVIHPGMAITKSVDRPTAAAGDTVTYTITVTNTGDVPLAAPTNQASIADDLTGVLDDAVFGTASADLGTPSFTSPTLSWSGDLPVGATATITYTVTVNDPITGDGRLLNAATGTTPELDPGPPQRTDTPIAALALTKSVDRVTANAPDTVTYTITVTNTGQTDLVGASIADDLTGVVDDATFGAATATTGTATFTSPTLTWTGDLPVGATATITYTVTVNNPLTGDGLLVNSARHTTPSLNPAPPVTTTTPIAALAIDKVVDRPTAAGGDTVTYTITVRNIGQAPIVGASIADDLTGVLDDAAFGTATVSTGSSSLNEPILTWTGDLPVGGSATITYTVTVNNPLTGDGHLDNTVTSTTPGMESIPAVRTSTPVADIDIAKIVDRPSTTAGDVVTYTITVTNTGQVPFTAPTNPATFSDDLTGVLDDATFGTATATTGSATFTAPALTWTGDLPVGGSATITYTVTVNDPLTGDGRLDNAVTNTTSGLPPEPPVVTSTPITAMAVTKTVDRASAAVGDTVTYTITVANTGQTTITGATITDDLTGVLDDATVQSTTSSTGTTQLAPPTLTWTGDLPVGGSATITYTVTVHNPLTGDGTLTNAVTNTTPELPPQPPVLTSTPIAAMEITKSVDRASAAVGDTVTYTITVTNTGQVPFTAPTNAAAFSDDLTGVLDDATFGTATATTGTTDFSYPTLTWTGDLPVGATATITYTVTVHNPLTGDATLDNAVTNTTPEFPPQPPVLTSTPVTAMEIAKTVDRFTAATGDTVTYSITVTNTGQTTIAGATITDDLSGVLDDATFGSASASTGTTRLAPPLLTWTGNLPVGSSATITYTVTVNNPVTGDATLRNAVTNTTPELPPGPPVETVTPIAALVIDKTVDTPSANPGDTVTYTITVTNTGQAEVLGATITDDLSGVLDDATFGTVTTATGTAGLNGTTLTWTGDLPVGTAATITYTVTVNDPLTGDGHLDNAVTNTTPGFPPQPPVLTSTPVAAVDIIKSVDRTSAAPGDTVTYTVTVTNTGQAQVSGASITDDLSGVVDDATFGTATATTGSATFTAPTLTWTGDLPVGGSATITYTVTVNNPVTGDGHLDNTATNTTPASRPNRPPRPRPPSPR